VKNLTGRIKLNKTGGCEEVGALEEVFQKYSVIYDPSYTTT
jgi:hypothetical protein